MSKFHDFDAMWAEAMPEEAQRPKVRIFGEEIILPASAPARVMLIAMRAAEEGDDAERALSAEEIYKLSCAFYGAERVEQWFDRGMTLEQLVDVFGYTMSLYNRRGDEANAGNEVTPTTGGQNKAQSSKIGA